MKKFAVVLDGLVVNTVVWDGVSDWNPNEGEAIEAGEDVGIGWSYANGEFSAPPVPKLTQAEIVAQADIKKASFMQTASSKISVLQDAVDYEMATAEETAALTAWKKYRVLLNRIDTSIVADIEWPALPEN